MRAQTALLVAAATTAAIVACQGEISGPGGSSPNAGTSTGGAANGDEEPFDPEQENAELLSLSARRLSHDELLNTMADLFGVDREEEESKWSMFNPGRFRLVPDAAPDGYDNNAAALQPSGLLVGQYDELAQDMARGQAKQLIEGLDCAPADGATCSQQLIESFGARAFRRPLTDEEVTQLDELFWVDGNEDFTVGTRLVVQAMLTSPEFLYRIELGRPTDDTQFTPYETASRLSYLLWRSMPDQELFDAAARDELKTPEQVRVQAERMLQSPKAEAAFVSFFTQWMRISNLELREKRPEDKYPGNSVVEEEAKRFLSAVLFQRDGTLSDLLTSRTTFVNSKLAPIYGVAAPADDAWAEVELGSERAGGFLTQTAFLAGHGHPNNPSPVLRGVFLLERVLCIEIGLPPPEAMQNAAIPDGAEPKTNREEYELLTSGNGCSSCHDTINPAGFAFEHFDTVGRYLENDNGHPIDPSGELPGLPKFNGAPELAGLLAKDPAVSECLTENWIRFALGGALDAALLEEAHGAFAGSKHHFRELLLAIATSPSFYSKRFITR